ncbi:ras-related protein Rab-10-like [Clavelina lepadiformis]|uniref:ras-related protein Rab-10-like n=1 Tax=Clavelina lepadiformis TaxID=159417 RepID=UPI00404315F2
MDLIPGKRRELTCKLITIGDTNVGKTSVSTRFTDNQFSYESFNTIGIDFRIKMMNVNGKYVKVQIWDTAGQERFRSITTEYYRGAKGVIFVYDITDKKSFSKVNSWCRVFDAWGDKDAEKMLVGNKCDLEEKRQVEPEEGKKLAEEKGMMFYETSAKDNINIDHVFMKLLSKVVEQQIPEVTEPPRPNKVVALDGELSTSLDANTGKKCCSSG